ncbi:MAG: hypothetical protein NT013_07630, partial [Planctomycetia bacterium]|nr:hypothetical protein [Planctomycetia bacterium]
KRKVLVHRWDSIPKRIFPKHPNANLPAMFSSTSLLFRILAFEIHDRRLKQVEWIHFRDALVTPEGVTRLQKLLPNCRFVTSPPDVD